MKKHALRKNTLREIWISRGRFFSIFALIALAVFAFSGLKITGSNMRATAEKYYDTHNLADISIVSTLGLDDDDKKAITSINGIAQAEFGYFADGIIKGQSKTIRVLSKPEAISTYEVQEGRLPKTANEIALDAQLDHTKYKIGDSITLEDDHGKALYDRFQNATFTIVGYVNSSEFIELTNRGSTQVGTGQLNTFGVTTPDSFVMPVHTIARLTFQDTEQIKGYDDNYQNLIDAHTKKLEAALKDRPQLRLDAMKAEILQAAQKANPTIPINPSMVEEQFNNLKAPVYRIQNRSDSSGYEQYKENSTRIDVLSNVFPVFFFAIAALVCLTTMTRMVEEQRTQMGTMKALGYSNFDIMKKYLIYGCTASLLGAILGILLGHEILPRIIFTAYSTNFVFETSVIQYSLVYCAISIFIALSCTAFSTILSAHEELKENAAELMRPKPPKNGTRILLERVSFLWKRLSFSYKVTARNIFRYKKRMFMTIIGIAGCTALLITGFGIKDSLAGIANTQYNEILHYDLLSIYNKDATSEQFASYTKELTSNTKIDRFSNVSYNKFTTDSLSIKRQDLTFIVPEKPKNFSQFITLQNRVTKERLRLSDTGAIISEKLASLLDIQTGDSITIKNEDGISHTLQIQGITEMYSGHTLYASPSYYEKVYQEKPSYNASFIIANNPKDASAISKALMKQDITISVLQSNTMSNLINDFLNGLNKVVIVLIICASLLAFVVLYNLTNINVSERIRELSTIKVLGFYPGELTMYVYRETIFLTIIGILCGYIVGFFLHRFIITTLPPDNVMFAPAIHLSNYIVSAALTLLFTGIVMCLMHRKLKRVDMIEALKSIE